MKRSALALAAGLLASPLISQEIVEPRSGAKFPAKVEDKSLLGAGLRTKTFLKVRVYALGLYVADAALAGPLGVYSGQPVGSPAFYKELVHGDFPKQLSMKFLRNLDAGQIQDAMREALAEADRARVDAFVGYFPAIASGQECVLRWAPGGTLETVVAGTPKPPIADRAFASAVFAIWLGDRPIQEDLKKALVSRAGGLLR